MKAVFSHKQAEIIWVSFQDNSVPSLHITALEKQQ